MEVKHLCIHGHFYQPPREDPWLDMIFPEGSAAPFRHWNERICRESYAPLAFARRVGADGIFDIINCYEWMSFNVGPTLFNWLERSEPQLYSRILEGDARSLERWGHGNAIAQVYHHAIMPLASELDKQTEVAWAIADFKARFKRMPEGMWLPETACDTASLEVLAEQGIKFTLLAPRQAQAVSVVGADEWRDVDEYSINIKEPYLVELPSGRTISVFFYDGGLSQAVAFENLLRNGEDYWNRLSGASSEGLLSIGTDGETYGHHVEFGEMALAYVLSQAMEERDGIRLLNYGAYLQQNPPQHKVRIRENSSWSCYHGIERWRSDCGCCTGEHPGWNQHWRKPLREGLDDVKSRMDKHFFNCGEKIFNDSAKALFDYGAVVSGSLDEADFFKQHFKVSEDSNEAGRGWKLLSMQKWALSSFASCGWFFDDLARLEPLNNMRFILRAMEIARETGLIGLEKKFLSIIGKAWSNEDRYGSGAELWKNDVRPQCESAGSLIAQALLRLSVEGAFPLPGEGGIVNWPGASVVVTLEHRSADEAFGTAEIKWNLESEVREYEWKWSGRAELLSGEVKVSGTQVDYEELFVFQDIPWKKKQSLSMAWVARVAAETWDSDLQKVSGAEALFIEFEDYQTSQTWAGKWTKLWSGLVWNYLFSDNAACDDFVRFIAEAGADHPDSEYLRERLARKLCSMLDEDFVDCDKIGGILERAALINLELDLWSIQNCYWLKKQKCESGSAFNRLLGFDM